MEYSNKCTCRASGRAVASAIAKYLDKASKVRNTCLLPKYHCSTDSAAGLSAPSFRRLARRGGVKRISSHGIWEEGRGAIRDYLLGVLHDAVAYTDHNKWWVSVYVSLSVPRH